MKCECNVHMAHLPPISRAAGVDHAATTASEEALNDGMNIVDRARGGGCRGGCTGAVRVGDCLGYPSSFLLQ